MKNLKKIREKRKITQVKLGMDVEVAQETVSAYESGKAYPNVETLLKLCEALHVSADYLLALTDVESPVNDLLIDNLSAEELNLVKTYRALPPKKKERLSGYLEGLSER